MTNKELQEILKKYPDDSEVEIAGGRPKFKQIKYVEYELEIDTIMIAWKPYVYKSILKGDCGGGDWQEDYVN